MGHRCLIAMARGKQCLLGHCTWYLDDWGVSFFLFQKVAGRSDLEEASLGWLGLFDVKDRQREKEFRNKIVLTFPAGLSKGWGHKEDENSKLSETTTNCHFEKLLFAPSCRHKTENSCWSQKAQLERENKHILYLP